MLCKPRLFVACILALAIGAWGRCLPPTDLTFPHPPTPSHSLQHVCFGVVRYPFFVPPHKEPADLNAEAIALLNGTMLGIFPPSCQTSVLEMVCGAVYMQCDEEGNFDLFDEDVRDFLAGQPDDLSFHFKRPCSSLCTTATTECWKLLPMLAPDITCEEEHSWLPDDKLETINVLLSGAGLSNQTGVAPLFDDRDNATYCNMVQGNMKTAGTTMEPYKGEVCREFADEIYIPAGPALSLAPLQPPGVIQTAIEQQLAASFKKLPAWIPYECMYALRKLFCTSVFMRPQIQSLGEALANNPGVSITELLLTAVGYPGAEIVAHEFYLPQYPHYDFCEDYNAQCTDFLSKAKNPMLTRDCNAVEDGVRKFPNAAQVLTTISKKLPVEVPLTLTFSTDPNNATYGAVDYAPQCPQGFAIPEDLDDEDNKWVEGTPCAATCASPIWSKSEWKFILSLTEICSGVALLLATIHLLWWTYDKVYQKRPLAYMMVINVLLFTLPYGMKIFVSFEEAFCRNNVNGLDESDGFTFCYYSGLSIWYFGQVVVLNWLCIATDIYVRVVLGHKRPNTFLKVYIPCVYLLPLPVTLYAVLHKHIGFDKIHTYCFVNDDGKGDIDLKLWYYPNAALCVLGTIQMCTVVYKIWTVTGSASKQNPPASSTSNFARKLKPLIVPIKFVVFFLIIWFALFAVRWQVDTRYDRIMDKVHVWGNCVFANFDGSNHWMKICGETPSERVGPETAGFIMAAACSIATITFLIFMVSGENFKRISKALHPGRIYALTTGRSAWVSEPVSYPSSSQAISGDASANGSSSPTAAASEALTAKDQAEI